MQTTVMRDEMRGGERRDEINQSIKLSNTGSFSQFFDFSVLKFWSSSSNVTPFESEK